MAMPAARPWRSRTPGSCPTRLAEQCIPTSEQLSKVAARQIVHRWKEGAMSVFKSSPKTPRGLFFEVADLTLMQSWTEACQLRMAVRLDHGSETEDFEEVIVLYSGADPLRQWCIWRELTGVFVQPVIGPCQQYGSAVDAIEALAFRRRVVLTDINATHWPSRQCPAEPG